MEKPLPVCGICGGKMGMIHFSSVWSKSSYCSPRCSDIAKKAVKYALANNDPSIIFALNGNYSN